MSPDSYEVINATMEELHRLREENEQLKVLLVEIMRQVKEIEQNLRMALDKDCK